MTDQEITCVLNDGGPYGMRIKGGLEFGCSVSVENVNPGSKADRAGIKQGDVILQINGNDVSGLTHEATKSLIAKAGSRLEIKLRRGSASNSNISRASNTSVSPLKEPAASPETPKTPETPKPNSAYVQAAQPVSRPVQPASFQPASFKTDNSYQKPAPTTTTTSAPSNQSSNTSSFHSNPPPKANVIVTGIPTPDDLLTNKQPNKIAFSGTEMKLTDFDVGTCYKCGQKIGASKYLKLDNRIWHAEHFCCEGCGGLLASTGFYEEQKKIFCKNCFGSTYAPKCAICGQACVDQYLTANDRCYHSTCFKCKKCAMPLAGKPLNFHDNYPHCMECFSDILSIRCDGCAKPIRPSEQYLEVKNKQYHEDCFRCSVCNESLASKGRYVIRDGRPSCPNH